MESGGATTLFNAVWPRFTPSNFRTRSEAGYGSDWPIGYQDLLPHYERTDREVEGASGLAGNPRTPPAPTSRSPPCRSAKEAFLLWLGHSRARWRRWPETNAILSAPYDGRDSCVQRGTCNQGCGEGAKGTADLTFWRHVVAGGAGAQDWRPNQSALCSTTADWSPVRNGSTAQGRGIFQVLDVSYCALLTGWVPLACFSHRHAAVFPTV